MEYLLIVIYSCQAFYFSAERLFYMDSFISSESSSVPKFFKNRTNKRKQDTTSKRLSGKMYVQYWVERISDINDEQNLPEEGPYIYKFCS